MRLGDSFLGAHERRGASRMPVWSKLPEAQRWQLVSYLRTLKIDTPPAAAARQINATRFPSGVVSCGARYSAEPILIAKNER